MNATAWAGQAAHVDHSESTCIQLFGKIYMIDPTHEIVLFAWHCGGRYAEEAPTSQDKWEGAMYLERSANMCSQGGDV